jgi:hypothetical protein
MGMTRRIYPLVDPQRKSPGKWDEAPFTLEEAAALKQQIESLTDDKKKKDKSFEELRNALMKAQSDLNLEALDPQVKLSDKTRRLKATARSGENKLKDEWEHEALKFGRFRAGIPANKIKTGNKSAIRTAAEEVFKSGLFKGKPGRPKNHARDEYVAVGRTIYTQLTGKAPTYTRRTENSKKKADLISGQSVDFMRAALRPFDPSDEQIAEAIFDRKGRR